MEDRSWGTVEVLYEDSDINISIETVYPGKEIPPHHHNGITEVESVISGEGECLDRKVRGRDILIHHDGVVHGYRNTSTVNLRIVSITSEWSPDNEIFEDGGDFKYEGVINP